MPPYFNSYEGARLTYREVIAEVVRFMEADPKRSYRVTIGTDSSLLPDKHADFVTAVVVHRIGNGARYFWRRGEFGKFHTLRDRIIQEVIFSLDIAKELLEQFRQAIDENIRWEFEIHADIGNVGPTSTMLQEVVGMIRAHNFEPQTKPMSYAASSVADRHV